MSSTAASAEGGGPPDDAPTTSHDQTPNTQQTPTLNTLLSKPNEGGPTGSGPPSGPPSTGAPPQFASPQQSPVPRGPARPESRDKYSAAPAGAATGYPPRNPQLTGVQAQEWAQPRSPVSPAGGSYPPAEGGQLPHGMPPPPGSYPPPPAGYPPGAPPHGYWQPPRPGMHPPGYPMHPGYGYPGMPPQHPGYHPGYPGHPGIHPAMRPGMPSPQDLVKMPPGPNPMEWAAMQRHRETNADGAAPSPANSTDDAAVLSPAWPNQGQYQPRPGQPPPGPTMAQAPAPPPSQPEQPQQANRKDQTMVDKLVGLPSLLNPVDVMPARRAFFEKLVTFCERHGEAITQIPQVSKQNVDLHRLYIAVRNKGGFEQVTKDKAWKAICQEANREISESSAAGYQLRRHYQRHLLLLECMETGRNADEAVAFADKLKKNKKKEPAAGGGGATPVSAAAIGRGRGRGSGAVASGRGRGRRKAHRDSSPPHSNPSTSSTTSPYDGPPDHLKIATANATWYPQQQTGGGTGYLAAGGQRVSEPSPNPPPSSSSFRDSPQPGPAAPYYGGYYQGYGGAPPPSADSSQSAYAQSAGGQAVATPGRPFVPTPYAQYAMNYYQQQSFYRTRGLPSMAPMGYSAYPPPYQYYGGTPSTPSNASTPAASAPSPFPGPPGHPGYYGPPPGQWQGGAPPGYPPGAYPAPPIIRHPGQQPPDLSQMNEEQRAAYQRQQESGQAPTPATPYSNTPLTPSQPPQDSAAGSRAPSAGPPGAATPDSTSRLSAPEGTVERPASSASTAPPNHPSQASTPTPAASIPPPSAPSASSTPHYGQPPPMYPAGSTPQRPPQPGYPGYPPYGVQPGQFPHMGHAAYMHQQQMWHQQQQAAGRHPGYANVPTPGAAGGGGSAARPSYYPPQPSAPPPTGTPSRLSAPSAPPSAPSPGGSNSRPKVQPNYHAPGPSAYGGGSGMGTPSRPPVGPAHVGTVPPPGPAAMHMHGYPAPPTVFPAGSVEASSISQRRRRKLNGRDLVGATPRRLLMALRSGLDTEVVWALNSLTVILHDDSLNPPTLGQMPGMMNALVEHLWASLAIIWPNDFDMKAWAEIKSIPEANANDVKEALKGASDSVKVVVGSRTNERKGSTDKKDAANFTRTTRTGRKVHWEESEMPEDLKRSLLKDMANIIATPQEAEPMTEALTVAGSIAERAFAHLQNQLRAAKAIAKPRFRRTIEGLSNSEESVKEEPMEEEAPIENDVAPFFYRMPSRMEKAEYPNDIELEAYRPTALTHRDPVLLSITHRVQAISNILRGFSFLPGNETTLASNETFLCILAKFLKLCVRERLVKKIKPPNPEEEVPSVVLGALLLDSADGEEAVLAEVATQLREDAFIVISHLSVVLDLYDIDSSVSWGILDGLLHWAISATAEATDYLLQGLISPREYALESLCKLCVLERNVDLLLSTGPWPRIERLLRVLARLLPMHEESHHREFAVVILNALCSGSEVACWATAVETPAIAHLINFIESADLNMHNVMSNQGMTALRDNPELMGTSVGMLRRAASMLALLTKIPDARKHFGKFQARLLQFTMSHLMDTRVAASIAEALYDIQKGETSTVETAGPSSSGPSSAAPSTSAIDNKEEDNVKDEEHSNEDKAQNGHSPSPTGAVNGVREEEGVKEEEEDPAPRSTRKRSAHESNGKGVKKAKNENGFPSSPPRNGETSSPHKASLSMADGRTENGSAMTAVA